MESIKELRKLLQEEKVNPIGWRRPWGYKKFQRGPSIYLTRLLLPLGVTPNQVTAVSLLLGLVGCLLLLKFTWYFKLAGLLFLYLNILTDKVDGEIARYRKTYSLRGVYWDEINHLIIPPFFWVALVFGISKIYSFEVRYIFAAGFVGALSLMINRVVQSLAPQIYAKKYLKHIELFALPHGEITDIRKTRKRFIVFRPIGYILRQFQDFLVLIAATALVLVVETLTRQDAIFHPLLALWVLAMGILQFIFAIGNIIKGGRSIEANIEKISRG